MRQNYFLIDNHCKSRNVFCPQKVRIFWTLFKVQDKDSSFHDTCFCHNLTDQKSKKKFNKNCIQLGLNPGPLDHHSNALLTVLTRYVLARRFLKWALFHAPPFGLWSFLESIEHDFIKAMKRGSCWQLNVDFISVGIALAWWFRGHGFNPQT